MTMLTQIDCSRSIHFEWGLVYSKGKCSAVCRAYKFFRRSNLYKKCIPFTSPIKHSPFTSTINSTHQKHFNTLTTKMLFKTAALASLATLAMADSNLDWFGPKVVHKQVCGHPGDERPEDCDQFYEDVKNELHDKIMGTCKTASCSGSFDHYHYQVNVDAVFPPEAKGEFDTQVGNIVSKMLVHENQPSIGSVAIETKFTIPSKMILNRFGDGNEKGHMEITVTLDDEDGLCDIFKKVGTAASVIPEVGPFFGLINIADC